MEIRPARTAPVLAAWTIALAAGLVVGVLTSYLQGVLDGSWNRLANSGSVWSVIAFVVAVRVTRTRSESVGAGMFGLLGSVAGYYALASPLRDIATSWDERLLWTVAALVIGPLVGLAADLYARGDRVQRLSGGLAMCGLAAGEGLHAIARISSSDGAGWIEFLAAVVVAAVLCRDVRDRREGRIAGVVGVAITVVVFLAYGVG